MLRLAFSVVMLAIALAMVRVFFNLLARLECEHTEFWRELGEPQAWRLLKISSRLKTARFIYFSGQHRALADKAITASVYAMRALFASFLLGTRLGMYVWPPP